MKTPLAVLISDVHYNLSTIEVADAAMRQAIEKANSLKVPLIVAGDLHDSKANLRGECVNRMISTIKSAKQPPLILIGNHCKINEKSEAHSLEFLRPYAIIIDKPEKNLIPYWNFIPYQHDKEALRKFLSTLKPKSNIIMHQGIVGALDDTSWDKSAINFDDLDSHRVISGHYHKRQQFQLATGSFDYIGNPYTLTFGEANDPEKGYQILYEDDSLEFVPTKLRKHVIIEIDAQFNVLNEVYLPRANDIVWVKVRGIHQELDKITRQKVREWLTLDTFKLDLIPKDITVNSSQPADIPQTQVLDNLIDGLTNTEPERKLRLKELWKSLEQK